MFCIFITILGSSAEIDRDPADTTPAGGVWVDDPQGNPKLVRSSGYRIFIPEIHGTFVSN